MKAIAARAVFLLVALVLCARTARAGDPRLDYFTVWPHVKNFIPQQSIYNFGRLQEVWLDK